MVHAVTFIFLVLPSLACPKAAPEQLKAITKEIRSLKSVLSQDKEKRDSLHDDLAHTEKKIGKTLHTLQKVTKAHQEKGQHLKQINQQQDELEKQLGQHNSKLAEQIKMAYFLNDQSPLQLLLNAENWHHRRRLMHYHHALYQARQHQIGQVAQLIEKLVKKTHQIHEEKAQLDALLAKQDRIHKTLLQEQNRREAIFDKINRSIANKADMLLELETNKKRLENVVKNIQRHAQQKFSQNSSFPKKNQNMPRPTSGKIIYQFGEKQLDHAHQNGIFIANTYNTPVYAVAAGQVAFADWLRGFGHLVIIEHQNGYMSLYAHNSTLKKTTGNRVHQKELIAYTGRSGGIAKNGLYFEIRQDGKPINPRKWRLS